jgi:ribonuclease BN (tRNA processing enzyme)
MELRVIGCHGGETPNHRTSAFVVDERLAIDAGSLTSGLDLTAQFRLQACLVSHAHLDHIRSQPAACTPPCPIPESALEGRPLLGSSERPKPSTVLGDRLTAGRKILALAI